MRQAAECRTYGYLVHVGGADHSAKIANERYCSGSGYALKIISGCPSQMTQKGPGYKAGKGTAEHNKNFDVEHGASVQTTSAWCRDQSTVKLCPQLDDSKVI